MKQFALYDCITQDPLFLLYQKGKRNPSDWGEFYRNLYDFAVQAGWRDNIWQRYLFRQALTAENIFTRTAAAAEGDNINAALLHIAVKELTEIKECFSLPESEEWQWERALSMDFAVEAAYPQEKDVFAAKENQLFAAFSECRFVDAFLPQLLGFHQQYGYGEMVLKGFWLWKNELFPVAKPDAGKLSDIIGYERQKQAVLENTEILIHGFPANHMLLYGERGTGKSSLVKAVAAHCQGRKLKLIEIHRHALGTLDDLIDRIKKYSYYFILFLDDLSFETENEDYKVLKNLLDGGVKAIPENIVIYATSNRKHLIKETWQDRSGGEEISKDGMTEKLSLVHRFGKTITFAAPTQEEYLHIVRELAKQNGIETPWNDLEKEALLWERRYQSRSGRTAVQFMKDFVGRKALSDRSN